MLPRRCRRATVVGFDPTRLRQGDGMMDTVLLAICFVAMGILVLAWAMLPHAAPAQSTIMTEVRPSPGAGGTPRPSALLRGPS